MVRVFGVICLWATTVLAGEEFFGRVGLLDEFAREVRRGTELVLTGTTRGGFRDPELLVIAPAGRTYKNKDNKIAASGNFTFTVEFEDGPGRYRMEIIARKPNSIQSLARFSVWHGVKKPAKDPEPPPPEGAPTPLDIHPRLVEKRWLARLNAFRASIRPRLEPVAWNETASARCREHAQRMANARRHIHKFPPHGGPGDMLAKAGAGKNETSGPGMAWSRISDFRPFPRPTPQLAGPNVYNYLVPFVQADDPKLRKVAVSMEKLFEATYVREAAHRICAADPNCIEVGMGIARPNPKPKTGKKKSPLMRRDSLYYATVFLQLNDKGLIESIEQRYKTVLRRAKSKPTPDLLRRVGVWGRKGKGLKLLVRQLKNRDASLAAAAFDGLLLLDEADARNRFAKNHGLAEKALERGDYGAAAALWRAYTPAYYDLAIARTAKRGVASAEEEAARELKNTSALGAEERAKRLKSLLRRAKGLKAEAAIRAALAN
ncbi:MAG: CAP domain-containing protein [Planctomycetota bacterium]|jgi:hypothetical protein